MRISDWSSDVCSSDLPDAEQLAEITLAAAAEMRRLNMEPKAALLSRSNFGSGSSQSGAKLQQALALIREREPGLEIVGEMHGDCALAEAFSRAILRRTPLQSERTLFIFPTMAAGN